MAYTTEQAGQIIAKRDAEIAKLNGRVDDAAMLIGYLDADNPVGVDARKWLRGEKIL